MTMQAVQDWLRVHRELLEMEAAFAELAMKVANGQASQQLLDERRQLLQATRELCTSAYQRAFPQPRR